jgi:hypothetical protein
MGVLSNLLGNEAFVLNGASQHTAIKSVEEPRGIYFLGDFIKRFPDNRNVGRFHTTLEALLGGCVDHHLNYSIIQLIALWRVFLGCNPLLRLSYR